MARTILLAFMLCLAAVGLARTRPPRYAGGISAADEAARYCPYENTELWWLCSRTIHFYHT
jgi:hypothetical protein